MYSNNKNKKAHMPIPHRQSALIARASVQEEPSLLTKILKNSLFGLLTSVVSGLILTLIMAFIAYYNQDPSAMVPYLSLLALLLSCFLGGFVCSVKTKRAPLLCGILYGGILCVFMFLCAACLVGAPKSEHTVFQGILVHGVAVMFCVLGAWAGSAKKKASPKKRRFGN